MRAIAIATGMTWDETHRALCDMSREMCTMPSANWLWGLWLTEHGFRRGSLPDGCPAVTVAAFCRRFPRGTFVLGTGTHAVAAIDGDWMDAWDSGDEVLTCFYRKETDDWRDG